MLAAGCSPSEDAKAPGEYVGETERTMSDLGRRDVFLRVDGQSFTKADFLVAVSMQDKIRRMCAGDPLTGENKPAQEYSVWAQPRTLSEILRHALIRQYVSKHGISATEGELDAYVKVLLPKMRRKGKTLQSVAAELGKEEGSLFVSYVEDDALAQPLRNHFDTEHTLDITDDDINAVSNRIVRYQEMAAASNSVERAALEKAIEAVKAGEDFAKVARRFSTTPNEGDDWGEYLLEELSDNPKLAAWVRDARLNDVSGILELDDGFSVVKVLDLRLEDVAEEQDDDVRRFVWRLARIARPYFETPDDMTREEIVAMLSEYRNKKLQERVGKAIMEQAVVEWPYGTNLFPKAEAPVRTPPGRQVETKGEKK